MTYKTSSARTCFRDVSRCVEQNANGRAIWGWHGWFKEITEWAQRKNSYKKCRICFRCCSVNLLSLTLHCWCYASVMKNYKSFMSKTTSFERSRQWISRAALNLTMKRVKNRVGEKYSLGRNLGTIARLDDLRLLSLFCMLLLDFNRGRKIRRLRSQTPDIC